MQPQRVISSSGGVTLTRSSYRPSGAVQAPSSAYAPLSVPLSNPLFLSSSSEAMVTTESTKRTTTEIPMRRTYSTSVAPITRTETRFVPPVHADFAGMATAMPSSEQSSEFVSFSREELIEKLKLKVREDLELRRLISSLRDGGDSRVREMAKQIEDLTKENLALKEQIYRLKNLANDELVMLEKVELKEVYGKKTKVQEELDAAKILKVEHEKTVTILNSKENRINELEREISNLRSQLANPPKYYTTTVVESSRTQELLNEIANLKSQLANPPRVYSTTIVESTRVKELQNEIGNLRNQLSQNSREFEIKLSNARNENLSMRSSRTDYDLQRMRDLENRVAELITENMRLKDISSGNLTSYRVETSSETAFLRDKVNKLENELQNANLKYSEYESQITSLKSQPQVVQIKSDPRIFTLEKDYRESQMKLQEVQNELINLKSTKQELETKLYNSERTIREIPSRSIDVTSHTQKIKELETEKNNVIGNLQSELSSAFDKLRVANTEILTLKAQQSQKSPALISAEKTIQNLESQIAQIRFDSGNLKSFSDNNSTKLAQQLKETQEELRRSIELQIEQSNQLHSANLDLKHSNDRVAELEGRLNQLLNEKNKITQSFDSNSSLARNELQNLRLDYEKKLTNKDNEVKRVKAELEGQIQRLNTEKAQLNSINENSRILADRELNSLKDDYERKIGLLKQDFYEEKAELENSIKKISSERDLVSANVSNRPDMAVRNLQNEKADLERKLRANEAEMKKMKTEYEATIQKLIAEKTHLSHLLNSNDSLVEKEHQALVEGYEAKINSLEQEKNKIRNELENQIRRIQEENAKNVGSFESQKQLQQREHQLEKQALIRKLDLANDDVKILKAENEKLNGQIINERNEGKAKAENASVLAQKEVNIAKYEGEQKLLLAEKQFARTKNELSHHIQILLQEKAELTNALETQTKIAGEATKAKNELERKIAESEQDFNVASSNLNSTLQQLKVENQGIKSELERRTLQLGGEKEEFKSNLEEKVSKIIQEKDNLAVKLQEQLEEVINEKGSMQQEYERRISNLLSDKQSLQRDLEKKNNENDRLSKTELAELERKIKALIADRDRIKAELEKKMDENDTLSYQLSKMQKELEDEKLKLKNLLKKGEKDGDQSGKVQELEQKLASALSEKDAIETLAKQNLRKLESELTNLERKLLKAEHEIQFLQNELELKANDPTKELLEKRIQDLQKERQNLLSEKSLAKAKAEAETFGDLDSLQNQLVNLSEQNKLLKDQFEKKLSTLKEENQRLKALIEKANLQGENDAPVLIELQNEISKLNKEKKELQDDLERRNSQLVVERQAFKSDLAHKLKMAAIEHDSKYGELQDRLILLESEKNELKKEFEKKITLVNSEKQNLKAEMQQKTSLSTYENQSLKGEGEAKKGFIDQSSLVADLQKQLAQLAAENERLKNELAKLASQQTPQNEFSSANLGMKQESKTQAQPSNFQALSAELQSAQKKAKELEAQMQNQADPSLVNQLNATKEQLAAEIRRLADMLANMQVQKPNEGEKANLGMSYSPPPSKQLEELLADKERLIAALKAILRGAKVPEKDIEAFFHELLENKNLKKALACLPRLKIDRGDSDNDLPSPIYKKNKKAESFSENRKNKNLAEDFIFEDDKARRMLNIDKNDPRADDSKLNEQINLNTQLAEKNIKLLEEKQRLKDQLNGMKEQLKKMKGLATDTKDAPKSLDRSRGEHNANVGPLKDENQKLKEENVTLITRIENYQDDLKKKKKILLNELVNFVKSKNNFENSCYSELTRHSLSH